MKTQFLVVRDNGCREMDNTAQLHNLNLANLNSLSEFIKFLRNLPDERAWWRAIGWPEGYRCFNSYSEAGQENVLASILRKDRDERLPLRIALEVEDYQERCREQREGFARARANYDCTGKRIHSKH